MFSSQTGHVFFRRLYLYPCSNLLIRFLAVSFFLPFLSSYSLQAQNSVSVYIRPVCITPFFLPCLFSVEPWFNMTAGNSLHESTSRLGLHYALFSRVSFLLNLDSAWLPGMVCVNPHHDLVCITPFFLCFLCLLSARPWSNMTART